MEIRSEEDLGGQLSISLKLKLVSGRFIWFSGSSCAFLFENVNILSLAHLLQNFWPDGYANLTQMRFAE